MMIKTKKGAASRRMKKAAPRLRAELGEAAPRFEETAFHGRLTDLLDRLHATPPKEAVSRLEARIPTSLYQAMERAAKLRGLTLTAYVTATMGEDARRTIEEADILRLSRADQIAFAKALINPPAPNAKLLAAKRRHAELTGK